MQEPLTDVNFPVPKHNSWFVLDSTKVQAFMDCPRGFFFNYIMGWRKKESSIHLIFGSAWHDAMEHLLNNGYSGKSVAEAFDKFCDTYGEYYPIGSPMDDLNAPKNSANALTALIKYAKTWSHDSFETLYTEIAGSVPISPSHIMYFKLDALIKDTDGRYWSLEHKTTGRLTQSWKDSWELKTQVGTYNHVINCLVQPENVGGVIINGAVLRKGDNEFLRIPIRRSHDAMSMWLWETKHYVDMIEWNLRELAEVKESDPVMTCFPRNGESCSKFGCRMGGLCNMWANPIRMQDRRPIEYGQDFWDPTRAESVKHVFDPTTNTIQDITDESAINNSGITPTDRKLPDPDAIKDESTSISIKGFEF
jgi:hypothetical protein